MTFQKWIFMYLLMPFLPHIYGKYFRLFSTLLSQLESTKIQFFKNWSISQDKRTASCPKIGIGFVDMMLQA